jgi:hypothetical protein
MQRATILRIRISHVFLLRMPAAFGLNRAVNPGTRRTPPDRGKNVDSIANHCNNLIYREIAGAGPLAGPTAEAIAFGAGLNVQFAP